MVFGRFVGVRVYRFMTWELTFTDMGGQRSFHKLSVVTTISKQAYFFCAIDRRVSCSSGRIRAGMTYSEPSPLDSAVMSARLIVDYDEEPCRRRERKDWMS